MNITIISMILTCLIGGIIYKVTSAKIIKWNEEWVSDLGPPKRTPRACPECKCGVGKTVKRIIGGVAATAKEYPWMAYVQSQISATLGFSCGCSIINDRYCLTAAHCIKMPKENMSMFLGTHNLEHIEKNMVKTVLDVKVHEDFDNSQTVAYKNDIALIKFTPSADFLAGIDSPDYMAPVCLPEPTPNSYVGEDVISIGWGKTKGGGMTTDHLQKITTPVVDNDSCQKDIGIKLDLTENHFCSGISDGSKGTCQGDSGGPILRDVNGAMEAIGLVSFGRKDCISYGVNTRVDKYLHWIEENMDKNDVCSCPR